MKTITITETIMNSIQSRPVDGGKIVDYDKDSGISTIEYNNQSYWFSANGLDDSYFGYDATWKGVEDGEDSKAVGEWTYSVEVGDTVEYYTDENAWGGDRGLGVV